MSESAGTYDPTRETTALIPVYQDQEENFKPEIMNEQSAAARRVINPETIAGVEQEAMQFILDGCALNILWAQKSQKLDPDTFREPATLEGILNGVQKLNKINDQVLDLRKAVMNGDPQEIDDALRMAKFAQKSFAENTLHVEQWPPPADLSQTFEFQPLDLTLKGDLLGRYCHDVRQAPAMIVGYGSLLRDSSPETFDEDLQNTSRIFTKYFGEMEQFGQQSYRQLEKGVPPENIDSQSFVNIINSNFADRLIAERHARHYDSTALPLEINAGAVDENIGGGQYNKDLFIALTNNIAQNSIKAVLALEAIPPEGLTINYSLQRAVNKDGADMLRISFTDNGIGLRDPNQERFDFKDGDTKWDNKGRVQGTGVGMATLASVTRSFGGDLYLAKRSDGQRGTVTVLEIPISA